MALRTIKSSAESRNRPVFATFDTPTSETKKSNHINIDINKVMENLGLPQFTYESFKAAYDADPQIQELVDNFNSVGIVLNSQEQDDQTIGNDRDADTVNQMAKAATDLADNLG